jgi:hypothetical protein
MDYQSDSMVKATLYTSQKKPLLQGDVLPLVQLGVRNLERRFPGLKVVASAITPEKVELILDFKRLDDDLLRVLQSFKSEVKNLGKKKGLQEDPLWQWQYDEEPVEKVLRPEPET